MAARGRAVLTVDAGVGKSHSIDMLMLATFLAGRRPDPAMLALRNPVFREAMQHGIDLEARWVLNLAKRRTAG